MAAQRTFLNGTLAYCTHCGKNEFARIISTGKGIFLERVCPELGVQPSLLARDENWYNQRISFIPKPAAVENPKSSERGCPLDCGICSWHTNSLKLPIFSITNDCNLDCPKCFTYNRQDRKYYKTPEETRQIVDHMTTQSQKLHVINITGGEPTLHPRLPEIIECLKHPKIDRITMNTNGLRIAEDPALALQIKEAGIQLVLSLDTLDPQTSLMIHGENLVPVKLAALKRLEELEIPTTLLIVGIKGVNHQEIPQIIRYYFSKPFVRSITIQNITHTGKNGSHFKPESHITIDEVETSVCECDGFDPEDFFTPATYHPLCYSVGYFIVYRDRVYSLAKILGSERLREMTSHSYLVQSDRDYSEEFLSGLNRLWGEGESEEVIRDLKQLIRQIYPLDRSRSESERRSLMEEYIKMIYIHPHMDQDNFDLDRVSRCGDLVPDEQGNMIPACSYNLIYRQKDPRFWVDD